MGFVNLLKIAQVTFLLCCVPLVGADYFTAPAASSHRAASAPRAGNLLAPPVGLRGASPAGSPQGDGSITRPWDLQTALNQPAAVQPGDTIWLRGGTYTGAFTSVLTGTPGKPIIVRQYPGERATLDAATLDANFGTGIHTLNIAGAYAWYWGFEVMNSNSTRETNVFLNNFRGDAVWITGANTKCINLIVHDADQGFSFWEPAINSDLYGNLIYNNGWIDPTRTRGHAIYSQNQIGTKLLSDNVMFAGGFNIGLQIYGTSAAHLDNYDLEGNFAAVSGGQNYELGGQESNIAHNPILNNNVSYFPFNPITDGSNANNLGYTAGCANPVVTNNYFGYGGLRFVSCSNITLSGNTFYGVTDFYGSDEGVYTKASFPNNTFHGTTRPKGIKVFVRPNQYETGRANIAIFNWDLANTVNVDISKIGLQPGDAYELHNAEDYFGDVEKGTWDGSSPLVVQMNGHTVVAPIGWTATPTTYPEFGMFIIQKTVTRRPPQVQR